SSKKCFPSTARRGMTYCDSYILQNKSDRRNAAQRIFISGDKKIPLSTLISRIHGGMNFFKTLRSLQGGIFAIYLIRLRNWRLNRDDLTPLRAA
ncbi:hypothetical protein N8Z81_00005, partial [Akkermansiaceae bacterium]|nr:hypothetical protein [Akkermansiaceae bacterium]